MNIKGMPAIVTGGASGLGNATARMLADAGAKVSIFDLNEEIGQKAAQELGGAYFKVNVADDESVSEGLKRAFEQHGTARILVNCAGVAPAVKTVGKENVPHALDVYRRTIEVNLIGTFNMISKVAAQLAAAEEIEGERGVIVNTASVAAFDG
ncbi:MAG TPA: SDR family NAD(P)-dependent oxidoreductase, partial [Sphingobium sp.]|nr:SDR family NAD(P)-dependent oxidoreductase [Sphingobium sp.]